MNEWSGLKIENEFGFRRNFGADFLGKFVAQLNSFEASFFRFVWPIFYHQRTPQSDQGTLC
jgi:hypothetical protein